MRSWTTLPETRQTYLSQFLDSPCLYLWDRKCQIQNVSKQSDFDLKKILKQLKAINPSSSAALTDSTSNTYGPFLDLRWRILNFLCGASSNHRSKEIVTSFGNTSIGLLFNCVLPLTGNSPSLENSMKGGTFQKVKKKVKALKVVWKNRWWEIAQKGIVKGHRPTNHFLLINLLGRCKHFCFKIIVKWKYNLPI